jgi:predicted nuclease of predicted toxin-antitoxin system
MNLLADENIPIETVNLLIQSGHNVVHILSSGPGMTDKEVVNLSNQQHRTILTLDKDFGSLIFAEGHVPTNGVILVRTDQVDPIATGQLLVKVLKSNYNFTGYMTVVTEIFVRQRKF